MSVKQKCWEPLLVTTTLMDLPIRVVAARGVPYFDKANRLQSLNLYLAATPDNLEFVGRPVTHLPGTGTKSVLPRYWVHVHGGAWRDPYLAAASVEPAVALAFQNNGIVSELDAIISLNYSLTKFPTHPDDPYDPEKNHYSDPAREAVHPQHVQDVLSGLSLLGKLGLEHNSYILSSHSCGACIALQSVLQAPAAYGFGDLEDPVTPAALIGLNGLYDLPDLVHQLDPAHKALSSEYTTILSNVFGPDEDLWAAASPSRFATAQMAKRLQKGRAPRLLLLDQSADDQLVPINQLERLHTHLSQVDGMTIIRGKRARGYHALPWENGQILWDSVQDTLEALRTMHQKTKGNPHEISDDQTLVFSS